MTEISDSQAYNLAYVLTELVAPIAAVISVIVSAILARLAFNETRNARDAQLVVAKLEQYAQETFADNLRKLRMFAEESDDFEHQFRVEQNANSKLFQKINKSRREVKSYYFDIIKLYDFKLLKKQSVLLLCDNAGVRIFYNCVIPLCMIVDPKFDLGPRDKLLRLVPNSTETIPVPGVKLSPIDNDGAS